MFASLLLCLAACLTYEGSDPDDTAVASQLLEADASVPAQLDFGVIPAGSDSTLPLRIENIGQGTLEVLGVGISAGAPFVPAGDQSHSLAPGTWVEVPIRFEPPAEGVYTGTLTVQLADGIAQTGLVGQGGPDGVVTDVFVQTFNPVADVLIVVDDSGSMAEEQAQLNAEAGNLLTELEALGADYQFGVVTTDFISAQNRGRFVGPIVTNSTPGKLAELRDQIDQGIAGSGNERPFDAIIRAMTPPLIDGDNAGFLRPGAQITAIVLSDEDDEASMLSTAEFVDAMNGLVGDPSRTTMTGIAGRIATECTSNVTGVAAVAAPNLHAAAIGTGAGIFDICAPSWDLHILSLAYVATGHRLVFPISGTPLDPDDISVEVDGQGVPKSATDGWTYTNGLVILLGTWIPDAGQEVRITYEVP
jgi:hypothetical protein